MAHPHSPTLIKIGLCGRLVFTIWSGVWFRVTPWLGWAALASVPFGLVFFLSIHQHSHSLQARFLLTPTPTELIELLVHVKKKSPALAQTLANTYGQHPQYVTTPTLGIQLTAEEKLQATLTTYQALLKRSPTHAQLWWNSALILAALGQPNQASEAQKTALELDPQLSENSGR